MESRLRDKENQNRKAIPKLKHGRKKEKPGLKDVDGNEAGEGRDPLPQSHDNRRSE